MPLRRLLAAVARRGRAFGQIADWWYAPRFKPRRWHRLRRWAPAGVAGVLALAVAVAVAALVAGGGSGEPRAARVTAPGVVQGGGVELRMPPGWQRAMSARRPAPFAGPLEVVDSVGSGGHIYAERLPARTPTLLPAELRRDGSWTPGRVVALRPGISAYRFESGDAGGRTVVALATTAGVATVLCEQTALTADACALAAASLRVVGGRPLPARRDTAFALVAPAAFAALRRERAAGLRALAAARLPGAQAAAADAVATAYVAGAARLRPFARTLRTRSAIAALRAAGGAYTALARAARRGDRRRYDTARQAIADAERRSRRAVAALRLAGPHPAAAAA